MKLKIDIDDDEVEKTEISRTIIRKADEQNPNNQFREKVNDRNIEIQFENMTTLKIYTNNPKILEQLKNLNI